MSQRINTKDWRLAVRFISPIIVVLILALIIAMAAIAGYGFTQEEPPVNMAPVDNEDGSITGGILNGLFYVFFAFLGGILLFFLIKARQLNILELLFAISFGLSGIIFGILLFLPLVYYFYVYIFPIPLWDPQFTLDTIHENNIISLTMIFSVIYGIYGFSVIAIDRLKTQNRHNFLMITSGALLGSMFGIFFNTVDIIAILVLMSLYDIYAVFKGPLGMIFKPSDKNKESGLKNTNELNGTDIDSNLNNNLSVDSEIEDGQVQNDKFKENKIEKSYKLVGEDHQPMKFLSLPVFITKDVSIGLGDFVFYSALLAQATLLTAYNWPSTEIGLFSIILHTLPITLGFIGIILGAYITLRLLSIVELLPALPVSIFLGLLGMGIGIVLIGIL